MQNYVILTDSTCDLPQEIINKLNINIIQYEFTFDGENYLNSLDINSKEFYKEIENGKLPKTAQINSTKYIEFFEPFLKKGLDILFIGLSGALTGTYSSLNNAVEELKVNYNNKIIVVDSCSATLGQGLLVYSAFKKKEDGYSIEELENWLNKNKTRVCHIATVNDLFHLKRGGRISSSAAVLGSMLNVKPLIKINTLGALESFSKVRGRKAAISSLVETMEKNIIKEENDIIFIAHADCYDDANLLANEVKSKFNINKIIIDSIGPIIGAHTGSKTLAVFYWGKNR